MEINFECVHLKELCSHKSHLVEAYGHKEADYIMSTIMLLVNVANFGSLWPPLQGFRRSHLLDGYANRFKIIASNTASIIVEAVDMEAHYDTYKRWESIRKIKILSIENG